MVLVSLAVCYDRPARHVFVVSNGVRSLMLHRLCVVSVLLVWCYDRSAMHVSLLAMSCSAESTALLCGFGAVGVVI